MMNTDEMMSLCDLVRETCYAIHVYHGNGYLEKVYENALVSRLRRSGLDVQQQQPIVIHDEDGTIIGEYFADIVVNGALLVELKACRALTNEHHSQLLHYLKATGMEHGLLINFGSYKFEIKKFVRSEELASTVKERLEQKEDEWG
jgi:GxxExxY protein